MPNRRLSPAAPRSAPAGTDRRAGLRVRSLGSGSSGNALVIQAGDESLLVDCGVAGGALTAGLAAAGTTLSGLSAVVVSHEHGDHAKSLDLLAAVGVPIAATAGTLAAVGRNATSGLLLSGGRETRVGAFAVEPLPVSHDASEPCGFAVAVGPRRVTVLTDLGRPDEALADALADSDLIVVEANHDPTMLRDGPYPLRLKRRILSHRGHLSNADCAALLVQGLAVRRRPVTIWLAHLSRTNNRPAVARGTIVAALARAGIAAEVAVLSRTGHGQVWTADDDRPLQVGLPW